MMETIERIIATNAPEATVLIRFIVGLVFVSEGFQKFLFSEEVGSGRFAKIPISNPEIVAPMVGVFEIVCGTLIVLGLLTRVASIPLIAIMLTALFTTKIPILLGHEFMGFSLRKVSYYGVWGFLHESRTDLAMLFCSIFLLIVGGGRRSLDHILTSKAQTDQPILVDTIA
jgi:putative oxidoreductase